jgi:hypothetical protein
MGEWREHAQGTGLKARGVNAYMIARETKKEIREYKLSLHDMITQLIRHTDTSI